MPSGVVQTFKSSYLDEISLSGLFLRSKVSIEQRALANNYVMLKKIFSYTVVQPKVTNGEYKFLDENNIAPLEYTAAKEMHGELMKIVDLTNSNNSNKIELANKIFTIRVKELKYILANVPKVRLFEMKDGYIVLDKYLEFIAR